MNEVSECKVSLWFTGDELDPRALTHQLGRAPAFSISKGDTYLSESAEEMVASTGRWQLTSDWQTGRPLDEIIRELLAQLPADLNLWSRLTSKYEGDLFCALLLDTFNEETRLSPATLVAIGSRGLALHLDIYHSDKAVPPQAGG